MAENAVDRWDNDVDIGNITKKVPKGTKGYVHVVVKPNGKMTQTVYRYGQPGETQDPIDTVEGTDPDVAKQANDAPPTKNIVGPGGVTVIMERNPETGEYDKPIGTPGGTTSAVPTNSHVDQGGQHITYDPQGNEINRQALPPEQMTPAQIEAQRASLQSHNDTIAAQEAARQQSAEQFQQTHALAVSAEGRAADANARADRNETRSIASQERQTAVTEAGLTGTYNGQDTLQKQQFDFTQAQALAQDKRAEISQKIELHKMDAADAAAEYKKWFDENVTVPYQKMEQERLRADMEMRVQQQKDQQDQFAASNAVARQSTAQQAGATAQQGELALLPYRVGPGFAGNMAEAINGVAQSDPSKVHFGPGDFSFKAPDLQAIAHKATAEALKMISPYARTQLSMPSMPASPTVDFSQAPQMPRYNGPSSAAPVAPPSMPDVPAEEVPAA